MAIPILEDMVRQHAEEAAHLWNIYDHALLNPDDNPEMDEERIARVVERLNAHIDGLRVAGEEGLRIAQERFDDYSEAGELFVLRMLQPNVANVWIADLDLKGVRAFLAEKLG
jgi:hypothetical protein